MTEPRVDPTGLPLIGDEPLRDRGGEWSAFEAMLFNLITQRGPSHAGDLKLLLAYESALRNVRVRQ